MNLSSLVKRVSALLVVSAPAIASAQAVDTSRLRPIVVSATKAGNPGAPLTQAVTVISGDDLRARGVARVTDALREVPGATPVQSGSFGSVTSLFLRGGESRYTKVLIDGVPVNAAGGYFDFSHLTTDNIDRIEIVRGPASVLYGADAVTGMIQIFTRRATNEIRHDAYLRAGTYGTRDLGASVEGGKRNLGFTLGGGAHSSDGLIPFNNQYRNGTLSSSVRAGAGSAGEMALSGRYTTAEYHYPTDFTGAPVDTNSYRVQHRLTVGLDASRALSAAAKAHLLLASNDVADLTEDIAVPFGAKSPSHSVFKSRAFRRSAEGRISYYFPFGASFTAGSEYQVERERSGNRSGAVGTTPKPTDGFVADRHNLAYYSELLGTAAEVLSYNLSGRVDDNSEYGAIRTFRLGTSVGIGGGVRARASLATAFNAPSFAELRPTLYTVASPNLQPEQSRSWELGLERVWSENRFRVAGDYFNQRFSQLIQYVGGSAPLFLGSYSNLTGASSNGYEGEAELRPTDALRMTASFTVDAPRVTALSPSYKGSLKVGDALLRRPTHSATFGISYATSGVQSFGATATHIGKRPDTDFSKFPSPTLALRSYTRLDLSAQRRILPRSAREAVALTARVENALDRKYQDVIGFPAPRRVILVGVSFSGGR